MNRQFLGWAVLLIAVWGSQSSALPPTKIETINGFEVHFVNLERGDSVGELHLTPHGALLDTYHQMGSAHLLEHLLFKGTKLFPGSETYFNRMRASGVFPGKNFNGGTGLDHVAYFMFGNSSQAETTLPLQLSLMGGLEWNFESFMRESAVVREEVFQYMQSPIFAAMYGAFPLLLRPSHPLAARSVHGDNENLSRINLDDLKGLYARAYHPQWTKVAIFGNFSDSGHFERIREITRTTLHSFEKPNGPRPYFEFPSLFSAASSESERRLIIADEKMRMGFVTFEIPVSSYQDWIRLSLLADYLRVDNPGSLVYRLKSELGIISKMEFDTLFFNGIALLEVQYEPTDKAGDDAHTRIIESLMEAFASIRHHEISADTLSLLKTERRRVMERAALSMETYIPAYKQVLMRPGSPDEQLEQLSTITPAQLSALARKIDPRRALYVNLAPKDGTMVMVPTLAHPIKYADNWADLERFKSILNSSLESPSLNVAIKELHLPRLESASFGRRFEQTSGDPYARLKMTIDTQGEYSDTAVAAVFTFDPGAVTPARLLAPSVILTAFEREIAPDLLAIKLRYDVTLSALQNVNQVQIQATGSDRYSALALRWYLDHLSEFRPTEAELRSAISELRQDIDFSLGSEFSAIAATNKGFASFDPFIHTTVDKSLSLDLIAPDNVFADWKNLVAATNKEFYAVGDFHRPEIEQLLASMQRFSPGYLSDSSVAHLKGRFGHNGERDIRLSQSNQVKPGTFGLSRMYLGPKVGEDLERVAFNVLSTVLDQRVFNRLLGELNLGYVQRSACSSLDCQRDSIWLMGQTDSDKNSKVIVDEWDKLVDDLKSGHGNLVTDSEIEAAIKSVQERLSEQETSALAKLKLYIGGQRSGDARIKDRHAASIATLTVADVRAAARAHLTGYELQVVISGECEEKLMQ